MEIIDWPQTPLGPLWGELNVQHKLTALHWGASPDRAVVVPNHPLCMLLESYFRTASPLAALLPRYLAASGTPFQQRVWHALMQIPFGVTRTYGDLASALGTSARAVGGAVGANPIPIFIPCHRVVGCQTPSGRVNLTGFSAPGGLKTKTWLLQHEGVRTA